MKVDRHSRKSPLVFIPTSVFSKNDNYFLLQISIVRNKSFIFALDKTHFPFFPAALRRPDSVNSWVSPNRPTHTIFDFMKNPTHDAAKDTIAHQQDRLTCNGGGLFHETSARSVADVRYLFCATSQSSRLLKQNTSLDRVERGKRYTG